MKRTLLLSLFFALFCSLQAYEILILGDTHYDAPEVRKNLASLEEKRPAEWVRNLRCWEKTIPAMLVSAGQVASAKQAPFAIQLGDLTQGGCGAEELQVKAFENALQKLKEHIKMPLLSIKGNHDIHGAGAEQAYVKTMLPYLNEVLKQETAVPGSAHYAQMHEKDLFIYFDSIKPDVDFVEKVLDQHQDARHVFFSTHLPVLPCSPGRSEWIVNGWRPNNPEQRRRLVSLLARRNAIVLTAHIHRTTLLRYKSQEGEITQLTSYSMPSVLEGKFVQSKLDGEGLWQTPGFQKAMQRKGVKELLDEFKEQVYEYQNFTPNGGFNMLRVEEGQVYFDYYIGNAISPAHSLLLKGTAKP